MIYGQLVQNLFYYMRQLITLHLINHAILFFHKVQEIISRAN